MGYIADLSRYDPVEAVDQYDGVILNVEDPGCSAKAHRAHDKGIPFGLYSWVYPGDNGHAATRSKAMGDLLELDGTGQPALGHWLDYEQEGVTPADLTANLSQGVDHLGVYTYLYILPTVADVIGNRPLWLAYYPGANDGNYNASYSSDARAHGAVLHQFTSTNGTRDLNVVLDDARWSAWTGSTPATPASAKTIGDDDVTYVGDRDEGGKIYWKVGTGDLYEIEEAVAEGELVNGHGAPVPLSKKERIELGIAVQEQADAYFARFGLIPKK